MESLLAQLSYSEYADVLSGLTVEDLALLNDTDLPASIKPFHRKKLVSLARVMCAVPGGTAPVAKAAPRVRGAVIAPVSESSVLAPSIAFAAPVSEEAGLAPTVVSCHSCASPNLPGFRFCQLCGKASEQTSPIEQTSPAEQLSPADTWADNELARLRREREKLEEEELTYVSVAPRTAAAVVAAAAPLKQQVVPTPPTQWTSVKTKAGKTGKKKQERQEVFYAPQVPHQRTQEDDDLLRRHCYFGDRPKDFARLMQVENFDVTGVFATYYHATPLSVASGKGQMAVVRALLARKVPVNTKDDLGSSPLCWAVSFGHTEAVEVLLSHGADTTLHDYEGMTPLHFACLKTSGKIEIVRMLLRAGADVNAEEHTSGRYPLDVAKQFHQIAIVDLLQSVGAVCSPRKTNFDPQMRRQIREKISVKHSEVARQEREQVAEKAELARAKVVPRTKVEDDEFRGHCFFNNRPKEFALYLQRDDFDFLTPFEQYHKSPPIVLAASRGHTHIVKALLERGADVNAKNQFHSNALSWALSGNHFELCELLVDHGVDMNLPDIHNLCPIHYAVMRKDRDISALEFLLENGVDMYATSGRGETALAMARKAGRTQAVTLLQQYGARK